MRSPQWIVLTAIVACVLVTASFAQNSTPKNKAGGGDAVHGQALSGIVSIYASLADSILANKKCEKNVVRAIVEMERGLALAALDRAGSDPSALREAADRIASFATEGGAQVEPIRNRLLAGGHHHHADDSGADAAYDSGYVVLNKAMKRRALELSKQCAKLAQSNRVDANVVTGLRRELVSIAPASTGR